jgi:hypothetical protein
MRGLTLWLALAFFALGLYLLNGCTFVYFEGDGNTVTNTNKHGGGVEAHECTQSTPTLMQRLERR